MPALLNTASVMMCPHGGTVQAISANTRTQVGGAYALRGSDAFLIAGCPFATPFGPHPCVQVQWVATSARSRAIGDFTLTAESVGLCLAPDMTPQGTVLILTAEPRVEGV
jgi:hypothetical protein